MVGRIGFEPMTIGFTIRLQDALSLARVLDHLVIGQETISFSEWGLEKAPLSGGT